VPLPPAYRSLPRPSSPPCAQASPTCLRSLDYKSLFLASALRTYARKSATTVTDVPHFSAIAPRSALVKQSTRMSCNPRLLHRSNMTACTSRHTTTPSIDEDSLPTIYLNFNYQTATAFSLLQTTKKVVRAEPSILFGFRRIFKWRRARLSSTQARDQLRKGEKDIRSSDRDQPLSSRGPLHQHKPRRASLSTNVLP
jgi:hypothetical protein